MLAVLAAMM